MQICLNTNIYNHVQIKICTKTIYSVLITFNRLPYYMTSHPLSGFYPPTAHTLLFVEFPAGISLSKLSFYGQQLMRKKQRGSRMGEENISALGIKLAVFVWGKQSGLRSTSLST